MKIVLDTNVFISGIFWNGSPRKVLSLWAQNEIKLLVTKKILNEYLRVLHKFDETGDIAKKWGAFVMGNCFILEDRDLVRACRDSEDNKFLNCALAGKANYLVSGDNDLLSIKAIGLTKIIRPTEFLKRYKNHR